MALGLSLTEAQCLTALRGFLLGVLPSDVEVIRAQGNRVPEPASDDFVVMTPTIRERHGTNIDDYSDCAFSASIDGTVLTVDTVSIGTILPGNNLFGTGVTTGSIIGEQITGAPGGIGTYAVTPSQTVAAVVMAAGSKNMLQKVKMTVQLDVHGEDSADLAHILTTAFRDEYGVQAFEDSGFDVVPLYTSDPRQIPFTNEEQQIESRWVVDAVMECNPIVTVPQQFADALVLGIINVDVEFPESSDSAIGRFSIGYSAVP